MIAAACKTSEMTVKNPITKNIRFLHRVDFTYFIGAGIAIVLTVIAIISYNGQALPVIFPIVSLGAYAGVLIRGKTDPDSWGNSARKRRISAMVGFTAAFVIMFVELVLLFRLNFNLPDPKLSNAILIAGGSLLLLFIVLYNIWFNRISFNDLKSSYPTISEKA